jgi:hypothetical protein
MEQMERQFGKSHLRRVFWGFFGSICSICSICSMRAARQKKPRAVLGGREARLAVRGAIIPNCNHARKVGGTPLQRAIAARLSRLFTTGVAFQRSSAATARELINRIRVFKPPP